LFVAAHSAATPYQILAYDMSIPTAAPTLVTAFNATNPVTALTVANGYLYAAEDSSSTWLERFDLEPGNTTYSYGSGGYVPTAVAGTAPTSGGTLPQHRGYDVVAMGFNSVYVADDNGLCLVTSLAYGGSFKAKACANPGSFSGITAIAIDAGNLYAAQGAPSASTTGVYNLATFSSNPPTLTNPPGQSQKENLQLFYTSSTTSLQSIQAYGPNVFEPFYDTASGLSGLAGFDPTNLGALTSTTTYTPMGADGTLQGAARGRFSVLGPYVIVADSERGLVLIHSY
jgi:hypothetical protein